MLVILKGEIQYRKDGLYLNRGIVEQFVKLQSQAPIFSHAEGRLLESSFYLK